MTRASPTHVSKKSTRSRTSKISRVPTVASTGIQVRLVPVDPKSEAGIASLIASCEALRAECERLFERIIDLLDGERHGLRDDPRSRSSSGS